jgi:hypothetical protein
VIWLRRAELARSRGVPHCCRNVQPETTFGGPEALITRGVAGAADVTEAFIADIDKALVGKTDAKAIRSALGSVSGRFDSAGFEHAVETELVMGLMLGALDAAFEVDEGVTVAPIGFSSRLCMGAQFIEADKRFASRPLEQAIRAFLKREVVTKGVFDEMTTEAKRRAFTVAGMASTAMIDTVKSELANAIDAGTDLRDFRKFAKTRLEGAGWTPSSASHVETIFRTNVMEAYNGGRHRQMSQPAVLLLRPYWQVMNPNDGPPRQRKNHQAAYLAVFRADDPVFPGAIPPWDFNCRDHLRSLSQRQLERSGLTVRDGSFLTNLGLPAPGFGGGEGPGGTLAGPAVKPIEPPEEPKAAPPPPKADPKPAPKAPRKPRRPRQPPAVAPAPPRAPPPAPPPAAPKPTPAPAPPAAPRPKPVEAPPAPKPPEPKPAPKAEPKPKAPRKPKGKPELRAVTPAEAVAGFDDETKAVGFKVSKLRVSGETAEAHRKVVYDALEEAGAGKFFKKPGHRLKRLTVTDKVKGKTTAPTSDFIEEGANGIYFGGGLPQIKICTTRAFDAATRREIAWSTSSSRKSMEDAIRTTTIHEFGHVVHLDRSDNDYDLANAVDVLVLERWNDPDREQVSRYSLTNRKEYFAESFASYHVEPEYLKGRAPKAFAMVEKVMKLRGML